MSATVDYPHLSIDADGTVRIGTTRYKVSHLAAEHYCYGWSAEELLRQHSDLRPEQVYAAPTYFYDHYDELVAEMHVNDDVAATQRDAQRLTRAELLQRRDKLAGK